MNLNFYADDLESLWSISRGGITSSLTEGILRSLVRAHLRLAGSEDRLAFYALDWINRCQIPLSKDRLSKILVEESTKFKSQQANRVWLWEQRVPGNEVTLVISKSAEYTRQALNSLIAHVTTGTPFPDGSQVTPGKVLLANVTPEEFEPISAELEELGANLDQVDQQNEKTPLEADRPLPDFARVAAYWLEEHPSYRLIVVNAGVAVSRVGVQADPATWNRWLEDSHQLARERQVAVVVVLELVTETEAHPTSSDWETIPGLESGSVIWEISQDPLDA